MSKTFNLCVLGNNTALGVQVQRALRTNDVQTVDDPGNADLVVSDDRNMLEQWSDKYLGLFANPDNIVTPPSQKMYIINPDRRSSLGDVIRHVQQEIQRAKTALPAEKPKQAVPLQVTATSPEFRTAVVTVLRQLKWADETEIYEIAPNLVVVADPKKGKAHPEVVFDVNLYRMHLYGTVACNMHRDIIFWPRVNWTLEAALRYAREDFKILQPVPWFDPPNKLILSEIKE